MIQLIHCNLTNFERSSRSFGFGPNQEAVGERVNSVCRASFELRCIHYPSRSCLIIYRLHGYPDVSSQNVPEVVDYTMSSLLISIHPSINPSGQIVHKLLSSSIT